MQPTTKGQDLREAGPDIKTAALELLWQDVYKSYDSKGKQDGANSS